MKATIHPLKSKRENKEGFCTPVNPAFKKCKQKDPDSL